MNYVEGFGQEVVYTYEEAAKYFKEQSESTDLPFIFLSAGVSVQMFQDTLQFANVVDGEDAAREWMRTKVRENIEALNEVLKETASSWRGTIRNGD